MKSDNVLPFRLFALFTSATAFCLVSAGATKSWQGGSGNAVDPGHWGGTAPVAGDVVKFNQSADYTVTFPSGVTTGAYNTVWFDAYNGHAVEFDGSDATFLAPTMETALYHAEPVKFAMDGGKILDLENYWGDTSKSRGLFRMDDFKFRLINNGTVQEMHFDKGVFNFYNPEGAATPVRHCFFPGTGVGDKYRTIVIHDGTAITFAGVCWFGNGPRDTLRVLGGSHTMNGDIDLAWVNNTADGTDNRIEVFNDAVFTLNGSVTLGKTALPTRRFSFLAADGGTLAFTKTFSAAGAGYHFFSVTNGGTIVAGGTMMDFSTGSSCTATSVVEIVDGGVFRTTSSAASFCDPGRHFLMHGKDGVLDVAGSTYFNASAMVFLTGGVWRISKICTVRNKDGIFEARGTQIDWTYPLRQNAGTLRLLDVNGNAAAMMIGNEEYLVPSVSTLEINGGAIDQTGTFAVGYRSPATLTINGGRHVFHPNKSETVATGHAYFEIGGGAEGVFTVEGDDTEVDFSPASGCGVYFGNTAPSRSLVRILGGSTTFREKSFFVSRSASTGAVDVVRGRLRFTGDIEVCRGTNTVTVSGGEFVVEGSYKMGSYSKDNGNGGLQVLNVRGGLADMRSIYLSQNDWHDCRVNLEGGVLKCTQLVGGNYTHVGGCNGWARFRADGGTIRARTSTANFLYGFDEAVLGEQGLTIDTDYNVTVAQTFTAASGVQGRLVKTGVGTLTLTSSLPADVTLEVKGGKVVFASGATCMGSAVVTGNATLGFAANAMVGALTLGDASSCGALELSDGASLVVSGAFNSVNDGSTSSWSLAFDTGTGATIISRDDSPAQDLVIQVDAGTSNVAENISYRKQDTLKTIVAAGATLNLSGAAGEGAIEKTGGGRLFLSNTANTFCTGATLAGGLFSVDPIAALGMGKVGSPSVLQSAGTFEFASGGETPMAWTVSAEYSTNAVVVKTDEDVTLTGVPSVVSGAIVKRGAGTLEMCPAGASKTITLSSSNGTSVRSSTPSRARRVEFDQDGGAPTYGYAGFNVAEGEVALRGKHTYNMQNSVMVGLHAQLAGAEKPVFTVDRATVNGGTGGYLFCVGASCMAGDEPQEHALYVTNGATLAVDTLCCGWFSDNGSQRIDVLVDASTVNGTYSIWPMHNLTTTAKAYYTVRNGSKMYSRSAMLIAGVVDMDFTDSVFAKDSTLACTGVAVENKSHVKGLLKFGSGSTAYIDKLNANGAYGRLTLAFDGGTWRTGSGDTALKVKYLADYDPSKIKVRLDAGGVHIPVAANVSLTVTHPLIGEGAFTKTGAGTMTFDTQGVWDDNRTVETKWTSDPVTWAFAGEAQIEEGTVVVKAGATEGTARARIASDTTLSLVGEVPFGRIRGAGTVSGGTLSGATLVVALDNAWANTNEIVTLDCALSGVTKVDFGIAPGTSAPKPLPHGLEVANFTGSSLGAWKGVNLGDPMLTAAFRLEDGKVLCDFRRKGMIISVK